MKCRQLTVETISDVNSPMVISPSNLLTLKFNDSTTQKFEKVDLYDRKWLDGYSILPITFGQGDKKNF